MTGMATLTSTHTTPREAVHFVLLGLRAAWLNERLHQPALEVITPRDRELITMVATSPFGVSRSGLIDLQRRLGTTTPGNAVRWVDRLVAEGWLEFLPDGAPDDPRVDLPAQVRNDLAAQADQLLNHHHESGCGRDVFSPVTTNRGEER